MRFQEPKQPPKLRERIRPSVLVDAEIKAQLKERCDDVDVDLVRLDVSTKSELEAFLWRDIEYYATQDYVDQEISKLALQRLRENRLFIDTIDELVEKNSKDN